MGSLYDDMMEQHFLKNRGQSRCESCGRVFDDIDGHMGCCEGFVEPTKPLLDRLRELCDDCLRAPQNRYGELKPCCRGCSLKWEAAAAIDELRGFQN